MTLFLLLSGCSLVSGLLGDPGQVAAEAESKLKAGDLPAAAAAYEAGLADHPDNLDLLIGAAWTRELAGDHSAADDLLVRAEAVAGEAKGGVVLRRALVAVARGDLDRAGELALASNEPLGRLLAAEVSLADGNRDAAREQLDVARGAGGAVGDVAGRYLELINDPNVFVAGLAETQALWALGDRRIAVRSVGDLVKAYAEGHDDGPEQLLVWAGRAASVGEAQVAYDLLDAITVPPAGQGWRVGATRAIAQCAEGQGATCLATFEAIAAGAPADGLADARATAAGVIAEADPATARALLAGLGGDAAARTWATLGDPAQGARLASDAALVHQLGG